jgi:hypothetical protein
VARAFADIIRCTRAYSASDAPCKALQGRVSQTGKQFAHRSSPIPMAHTHRADCVRQRVHTKSAHMPKREKVWEHPRNTHRGAATGSWAVGFPHGDREPGTADTQCRAAGALPRRWGGLQPPNTRAHRQMRTPCTTSHARTRAHARTHAVPVSGAARRGWPPRRRGWCQPRAPGLACPACHGRWAAGTPQSLCGAGVEHRHPPPVQRTTHTAAQCGTEENTCVCGGGGEGGGGLWHGPCTTHHPHSSTVWHGGEYM